MILVDSSVWIDFLRGHSTRQTNRLDSILGVEPVATGDLILTEVLQGLSSDRDFKKARELLSSLEVVSLGGLDLAIQAAQNFRTLRKLGVTVRKTIDCIIATRCIQDRYELLHDDRDFDPFAKHLGLRTVTC